METITTLSNLDNFLNGIKANKAYPKGLRLNFRSNKLSAEGTKALLNALQSGKCPPGLQLDLSYNGLGAEGAKALASALQSGHCPSGLQLNLDRNWLGAEGAKALANALQSGHCPPGLQLDLQGNKLYVEGAQALARALQSRNCPPGLQLELYNNQIGSEGAKALARALQSGHCPQRLQLGLGYNGIGIEGAQALVSALQSRQCPPGLQLTLSDNELGEEGEKIFQAAWAWYEADQQDKFLACMTLYHGHSQDNSIVSGLPLELLLEICRHSLPLTPVLAKMTEISAKVFRQQAASLKMADTSIPAKRLDQALESALSAQTLTEKAAHIQASIQDFLAQEWGTLKTKKLAISPTMALLCKYHLITGTEVPSVDLLPKQPSEEPEGQVLVKAMQL